MDKTASKPMLEHQCPECLATPSPEGEKESTCYAAERFMGRKGS